MAFILPKAGPAHSGCGGCGTARSVDHCISLGISFGSLKFVLTLKCEWARLLAYANRTETVEKESTGYSESSTASLHQGPRPAIPP
jgi:hypothetical protein